MIVVTFIKFSVTLLFVILAEVLYYVMLIMDCQLLRQMFIKKLLIFSSLFLLSNLKCFKTKPELKYTNELFLKYRSQHRFSKTSFS